MYCKYHFEKCILFLILCNENLFGWVQNLKKKKMMIEICGLKYMASYKYLVNYV